jgi:tetratricopeptide (TPR) repeat protein
MAALAFAQQQLFTASLLLRTLTLASESLNTSILVPVWLLSLDVLFTSWSGSVMSPTLSDSFLAQTSQLLQHLQVVGSQLASSTTSLHGSNNHDVEQQEVAGSVLVPLHLSKARMLLMAGQHKGAKREAKAALELVSSFLALPSLTSDEKEAETEEEEEEEPSTSSSSSSSSSLHSKALNALYGHLSLHTLYQRAHLETTKRNFRKALKILTSNQTPPPSVSTLDERAAALFNRQMLSAYLNNMGYVYLRMHRPHAALIYFRKALNHSTESASLTPSGKVAMPSRAHIAYNTALACW